MGTILLQTTTQINGKDFGKCGLDFSFLPPESMGQLTLDAREQSNSIALNSCGKLASLWHQPERPKEMNKYH